MKRIVPLFFIYEREYMIHYKGKFDGNTEQLPAGEYWTSDVPFDEPQDMKKLAAVLQKVMIVIIVLLCGFWAWWFHDLFENMTDMYMTLAGAICSACILQLAVLLPHEYLHALCFREDCWIYTNLKQGMCFVAGPEDMDKKRFIFMCLLPNIVFGFAPFIISLDIPVSLSASFLMMFGIINIGAGAGDYMNVYNAARQVPQNGLIYMHHMQSHWYRPDDRKLSESRLIHERQMPE